MAKVTENGLAELKKVPQKQKKQKCKHYWAYEHTVYAVNEIQCAIHRQCRECGLHEVARFTPSWSRSVSSFDLPDLRK